MSQTETPRAGRREWIGLAVIALPCLLDSMDLTVPTLSLIRNMFLDPGQRTFAIGVWATSSPSAPRSGEGVRDGRRGGPVRECLGVMYNPHYLEEVESFRKS
jgi:hypothetical protein